MGSRFETFSKDDEAVALTNTKKATNFRLAIVYW